MTQTLEYKCPCCGAPLIFGSNIQKLKCEYCDNTFDLDTVQTFQESSTDQESFSWEEETQTQWTQEDQDALLVFQCPSCGGQIMTDENTAASFCPYCENPTILPSRLSGGWKPDALIPFSTTKADAQQALARLCKGKLLLPRDFLSQSRLEKISGMYVPFWLYDCNAQFQGSYRATRVHRWSDAHYDYTRTEHYLLRREAEADFSGIPMDGSSKMEDTFMESIEPFDYSRLEPFHTGFLSGFLADKYDVPSEDGKDRIRQRVDQSMNDRIGEFLFGYDTIVPTARQLSIRHSKARYVLLPVWMLNSTYRGKTYTFAMNGQTGKITGTLPISPRRAVAWFAGISASCSILAFLIQWLMHLGGVL